MAKRRNNKVMAAAAKHPNTASRADKRDESAAGQPPAGNGRSQLFGHLASRAAHFAGKPMTFLIAVSLVLLWAISGPLFGFSDTWQLVINTSTTIVTFLMVFLIQNTQNRDALALQLKLAELIIAAEGAKNKVATIEDLCEEDLEQMHEGYRKRAEETLVHLRRKRDKPLKQAS